MIKWVEQRIAKTRVYTFSRGGIHYEDPSAPPWESSVTAFLPVFSIIPLADHTGSRIEPMVSVGDTVKEGMLVGRGTKSGLANVHASMPGRVVRTVSWKMLEGHTNDALVIRLEGVFDKLGRREEVFPWQDSSPVKLRELIAEYGVVTMESSGFPAAELMNSFQSLEGPRTLVVRCVFDDPWLAADYVLCRERLRELAEGSAIAARAAGAERILFAVSGNGQELGAPFLAEVSAYDIPASMVIVGSRYPQRNRRELEQVLRLYEKKEADDLGDLLILGPATLAAVRDAVTLRRPILDRYVAVGGSAVKKPQVMKVRLGTRIGDLFEQCGGFTGEPKRIATGSTIIGRTVQDLNEPVIKTTYAVFALREAQVGGGRSRNCIGCGECRAVCPMELDPELLFKAAGPFRPGPGEKNEPLAVQLLLQDAAQAGIDSVLAGLCHGCCCCDVVCPSRLPLSAVIANFAKVAKGGC
jgi:electron transport complex protein RnfC